jgi:pimeloyl-ACP methyl ester carboxylesterase
MSEKADLLFHKIYYTDSNADWVVFIHGAGGSSAIWYKQIKTFKDRFNVLLVDLRGHGRSYNKFTGRDYSFESIASDVKEVMEHNGINRAHFVGVSLGTIIIRTFADSYPGYVQSMILTGAITSLNLKSKFWINLGRIFKKVIPYMWLYRLFAIVIMPSSTQKESRLVFIEEAKKLCQKEFLRWYRLTGELSGLLNKHEQDLNGIPTLFLMGEYDHLFIEPVRKTVKHIKEACLLIVNQCGHVVNIEQADIFNIIAVRFLTEGRSVFPETSYVSPSANTV